MDTRVSEKPRPIRVGRHMPGAEGGVSYLSISTHGVRRGIAPELTACQQEQLL